MSGCGGCGGPGSVVEPAGGVARVWVSTGVVTTVLVGAVGLGILGILALASTAHFQWGSFWVGMSLSGVAFLLVLLRVLSVDPSCVLCARPRKAVRGFLVGQGGGVCADCAPWTVMPGLRDAAQDGATRLIQNEILQTQILLLEKMSELQIGGHPWEVLAESARRLAPTQARLEEVESLLSARAPAACKAAPDAS